MTQNSPLSKVALFYYGLMALPLSFAGLPIYLHAPDFYARDIGLSLTFIGVSLLILRLIDAFQDPLIGSLSDSFNNHRKKIILFGMFLLGGGFWMVFHPPSSFAMAWFVLSIFICTTGFSIVNINYQALGALWHAQTHERTNITGWREGFGLVGLLIASILPTVFGLASNASLAFHQLCLVFIPLVLIASLLFFHWMKKASFDTAKQDKTPLKLTAWFDTSWKKHFFGLYFVNSVASSIPAVLVIFFIRDRLNAENYTGLFLTLYFISGVLSMFFWQKIAKRIGKYHAWGWSMALAIITFIWAAFLGQGDSLYYCIICALSGIALGADLAIPPSLLADYIAEQEEQHTASRYFSIMAFIAKAALAVATGLTLPILEWLGYQPDSIDDYQTTVYLSIAYAVIPCLTKIIVLIWLRRTIPQMMKRT